ncbi:MAG: ATP-binding protein [Acidaminococcaceae bacterium]|nr:ATP-binding protein [Acidaminococcaceae bacterium]
MYINRDIENCLRRGLKMFKVLLLTGPRQVGKTTLLCKILRDGLGYNYVTLDDLEALRLAKEEQKLFFDVHSLPVIIDEVQYAPEIFRYIKLLVDEQSDKGRVCLTGSQAYNLMNNVSESLAGRIGILEMSGLSAREIYGVNYSEPFMPEEDYARRRKQALVSYTDLWYTIHRGALPALQDKDMEWEWFYRDYVKTYIERDVRQLVNIKDENRFYQFIVALAARTGQLFVASDIATVVGVTIKTVQNWTSILEASGIIKIVRPYFSNVLKRTIKAPKIYFMDAGLVCYLVGWNTVASARNGAMAGNIFETFVVSEIVKSYINAGKDTRNIYYYRDRDQKEIDLLLKSGNKLYPVEIKMSGSPQNSWIKNFEVLQKEKDVQIMPGAVVCQCRELSLLAEKTLVLPVEYI